MNQYTFNSPKLKNYSQEIALHFLNLINQFAALHFRLNMLTYNLLIQTLNLIFITLARILILLSLSNNHHLEFITHSEYYFLMGY